MNTVTSPDASRSHTATASNAPGASQHAPTASELSVTLTRPWTWFSGSTSTVRSAADHSHAATMPSTIAAMLPWVCTAPFGRPVVPLV